jgi:hypothetical protein
MAYPIFENTEPATPHPVEESPTSTPWVDSGTIYVDIDLKIGGVSVNGTTYATAAETGIYLPKGYSKPGSVDVILYLHGNKDPAKGHLDKSIRTIWNHSQYPLRKLFEANKKNSNTVLVAPTLGAKAFTSRGILGKKDGAIDFMDKVMDALYRYGPHGSVPGVGKVYLAAHSGGGYYLKKLVGFYEEKYGVAECWAFDCLYDDNTPVCAPGSYRICKQVNAAWPAINHLHDAKMDETAWRSKTAGAVEDVLASWAKKGKKVRAFWNCPTAGTQIRTANLALRAKLDNQANIEVTPDLYTGTGASAAPVGSPPTTDGHDDIPKNHFGECVSKM